MHHYNLKLTNNSNSNYKIKVFNCPIYHELINFITSKCTFMLKRRSSKDFILTNLRLTIILTLNLQVEGVETYLLM